MTMLAQKWFMQNLLMKNMLNDLGIHSEAEGILCVPNDDEVQSRPLSHDERNKLQAKILKAELKGNMTLASELRLKLERGIVNDESNKSSDDKQSVLLMQVNKRTGIVAPARNSDRATTSKDEQGARHTIDYEYRRSRGLQEMVAEEKRTSAEDQIKMFSQSAKMTSDNRVDDDWVVDDNLMSHPKKRRHAEKDRRKDESKRVKGWFTLYYNIVLKHE
uniref:Cwf19-like C-terminal domain-containing protein n=1 Tax=Acrobeloides nanus TaxID=290746 RepID=A0A914DT30_9BILA